MLCTSHKEACALTPGKPKQLSDTLSAFLTHCAQNQSYQLDSDKILLEIQTLCAADTKAAAQHSLFDLLFTLAPYDICLILEPASTGFFICTQASMAAVCGERWQIGQIMSQVTSGNTFAIHDASVHPEWPSIPLPASCQITSMLLSPITQNNKQVVVVFAHHQPGHYAQSHVHQIKQYKRFISHILAAVFPGMFTPPTGITGTNRAATTIPVTGTPKAQTVQLPATQKTHESRYLQCEIGSTVHHLSLSAGVVDAFNQQLIRLFQAQTDKARLDALLLCQQWYKDNNIAEHVADISATLQGTSSPYD